jgi:hypothetical protein
MMSYWRRKGKNERQLAIFGLLHGIAQGQAQGRFSQAGCSDPAGLSKLRRDLVFKP